MPAKATRIAASVSLLLLCSATAASLLLWIKTRDRQDVKQASNYFQAYQFTTVRDLATTPVCSQDLSGTCWSFSATSFLESEIIRRTGKIIDLSEMFAVRHTYTRKAWNYIMRQGTSRFTEGALDHDVLNSVARHGLVPADVYSGLVGDRTVHDHREMFRALETLVKRHAENKLGTGWKQQMDAVLDAHLGNTVTRFMFEGVEYTPHTFLKHTGLRLDEYITIASFTHAPFHQPFVLEIPANFDNERFYNLPLDEFIDNIDHAIANGCTLALDCDVSEPFFSQYGVAVIPENKSEARKNPNQLIREKHITQEFRQEEFETFRTTDDHLMHIVGSVKDQHGNKYYKAKNCWTTKWGKDGFIYMSVAYIRGKAISVMLHKDGLRDVTRAALGLAAH